MEIFWEGPNWSGATIEPGITCLAWMPSSTKDGCGLLAAGSESGVVGVTNSDISGDPPCHRRYNYNLRGHHSAVTIVAWNPTKSKLVSVDCNGFVYVWFPSDERWTVELVNDRGMKVKDFCWSPNGHSTFICYEDNFALIGTASGQRLWSNTYANLVTCGRWSPSSEEIVIGFNTGILQVINEHGVTMHERQIFSTGISRVAFSSVRSCDQRWTLAVCSNHDEVVFTDTYYEVEPFSYQSSDPVKSLDWSQDGTMLAVVCCTNRITILSYRGEVLHTFTAPLSKSPLTAFTWAHDDTAVVIAAAGSVAVGRVVRGVPLLRQLVSYHLWVLLGRSVDRIEQLALPMQEKVVLRQFDHHLIRCRVPRPSEVPKAICQPTDWRWYCTIVPVQRKSYHYMLCMEHMGGLVPILLGRQINRIIPQFVISLPQHLYRRENGKRLKFESGASAQVEDVAPFRRESNQRNSLWRRSKRHIRRFMNKRVASKFTKAPPTLVQVSSNVWCTKFKITAPGIDHLPNFLANVVYKTSVLHLQPRQMTIHLSDLREAATDDAPHSPIQERSASALSRLDAGRRRATAGADRSTTLAALAVMTRRGTLDDPDVEVSDLEQLIESNTNLANNNEVEPETATGPEFEYDQDTELLAEEKVFYTTVMNEFDGLCQALHSHIERMKQFAAEIELTNAQLITKKPSSSLLTRSLAMLTKASNQETLVVGNDFTNRPSTSADSSSSGWEHQLDALDFIDEDDVEVTEEKPMLPREGKPATKAVDVSAKKRQKQLNDIRSVVDKLSLMANELSTRSPTASGRNPSANLRVGNNAVGSKAPNLFKSEVSSDMTVAELRAEVRNIARQVSQIEEKITIDLLNDVRGDLLQRVQHIKAVLGDAGTDDTGISGLSLKKPTRRLLTMSNKTPHWNDTSQVYQLDFGGRVTQESAKNFQVEFNQEQVMQFGRIENGAYTLDFCSPFSAVQAFAIALASITQRLK